MYLTAGRRNNKMTRINSLKRISAALFAQLLIILCLTGCGSDKAEDTARYEQLKTDIVGMWCDEAGPEYVQNGDSPYYKMYEFDEEGMLFYHTPSQYGSVYYESSYTLEKDFLTVYELHDDGTTGSGSSCKVSVENGILTMTTNGGDSRYRRMTMEEICNFAVVTKGAALSLEQIEFTDNFSNDKWMGEVIRMDDEVPIEDLLGIGE